MFVGREPTWFAQITQLMKCLGGLGSRVVRLYPSAFPLILVPAMLAGTQ